jgi:hypothetical protein
MREGILVTLLLAYSMFCYGQEKVMEHGFVSYDLSYQMNENDFDKEMKVLYKEAKNKEDSLIVKGIIQNLKKVAKNYDNKSTLYKNYFFKDTVRITEGDKKTIVIPKLFKKHSYRNISGKPISYIVEMKEYYKTWEISYDVKIDKNDTKEILGKTGYKIKITETCITSMDKIINISEMYLIENVKFPLLKYGFLNLKNFDVKINGLILECKTYNIDTPKTYNLYRLKEFNVERQNRDLIKL